MSRSFDPLPFVFPAVVFLAAGALGFFLLKPNHQKVEVIPPEFQRSTSSLLPEVQSSSSSITPSITPSTTGGSGVEIIPPEVQSTPPAGIIPPPEIQPTPQTPSPQPQPEVQPEIQSSNVPGMSIRSSKDSTYSLHTVIGVVPVGTQVQVNQRPATIVECPPGAGGEWGRINSPVAYLPSEDGIYYTNQANGKKTGWVDLCGVQFN